MKRALFGAAGILALAVAIHLAVSKVSVENLRSVIATQLGEALGLEVRIRGDLWISAFPTLEVHLSAVEVANLPGRPSPLLLEVEEVRLELELRPLLRRVVAIDRIEIVGAALRIEPDETGAWALRPEIEHFDEVPHPEGRDPLELRLRHVGFEDATVFYDRPNSDHTTSLRVETLDVELASLESPLALRGSGDFEGSPFEVDARTGSIRELLRPTQPFPLEVRGRVFEVELESSGTIKDPKTFRGVDLRFHADIADLAEMKRDPDRALPALGRLRVSGHLEDRDGTLGVRELSLKTDAPGAVQLVVEGAIQNLAEMSGVELRVSLDAEDADVFEAFAAVPLPHSPIQARLRLSDSDGTLGVEGEASSRGSLELNLEGALDDLRRLQEIDVQIKLGAQTLATVPEVFEFAPAYRVPAVGPLQASGNLVDRDGVLGVDDLDLRVGEKGGIRGRVHGSARDLLRLRGLDLEIEVEAPRTRALAALHGLEIPELGPLQASALLSDRDGTLGLEALSVHVQRPGVFELSARGGFDDLRDLDEIEVTADLRVDSLHSVGELIDVPLPPVGPARFEGTLRGSDESLVALGHAQIGATEIQGEFSAELPSGQRPRLQAHLRSPHVFLPDLGLAPQFERPKPRRYDRAFWKRWWRGEETLEVERLRDLDLDLVAHAEKVTGRQALELQNLKLNLHLEDGELELRDAGAQYRGGLVKAQFRLNARTAPPVGALQLEAFNLDMFRIASQLEEQTDQRGLLDLSIDLQSAGLRGPDVAKALSGRAGAMIREGALVGRYSRAFTFNFLRVSIPDFPFVGREEEERPVRCLLALFDLDGGVASARDLFLEGQNITVTGAGTADLRRGEIDLRLTPHVHEPGLVSVAATVDVSGPITDPRIRAVRRSLGVSAARALIRNAMRPIRSAERVLRRRPEDLLGTSEPCNLVALQRVDQMRTDAVEPIDVASLPIRSESPASPPASSDSPAPTD